MAAGLSVVDVFVYANPLFFRYDLQAFALGLYILMALGRLADYFCVHLADFLQRKNVPSSMHRDIGP